MQDELLAALGRILPEHTLREVLASALKKAGLSATPDTRDAARDFVLGPLAAELDGDFGPRLAHLGTLQLCELLDFEYAPLAVEQGPASQTSAKPKPGAIFERETRPLPQPSWHTVLLATEDQEAGKGLQSVLGELPVRRTTDINALLSQLRQNPEHTALVVDGRASAAWLTSVTEQISGAAQPDPGLVVFWGSPDDDQLVQKIRSQPHWIQCSVEAETQDLGVLLLKLPNRPSARPPQR